MVEGNKKQEAYKITEILRVDVELAGDALKVFRELQRVEGRKTRRGLAAECIFEGARLRLARAKRRVKAGR